MADAEPRPAAHTRWRRTIVRHLEDLPRQFAALESAMASFGEDFDAKRFKEAFDTTEDMEAYNRVQALERAVGRVQNFDAELAIAGAKLAELPLPPIGVGGSPAQQAFEALRDASVIDGSLCRKLTRAQKARSMIEHSYVQMPAGDVHRAAELVHETARQFIAAYRDPVAPSVPWVLTSIWPELKRVAGPASARLDATLAVWGLFEASEASVTVGVGPEVPEVPPLRVTLV
jgi:hypothetical protein